MAIKRYFASKDNTITNAFKPDLSTRATASNMGLSDVSEVFSIYGQASSSSGLSTEEARVLISFPTTTMATDRTNGVIPASGSVSFYLKMYNADHGQTLPQNYYMEVKAVTGSVDWEEGFGLDMESFSDSTQDSTGSNWINANGNIAAATATITMTDYNEVGTGNSISVVTTDGSTVTITGHASITNMTTTTGDSTDGTFASVTSNATTAANIATALSLHEDLTAATADSGVVVTVTQASTGQAGNTTITLTDPGDVGMTKTDFTGGDGPWSTAGGDYINPDTDLSSSFTQYFDDGTEDLEVDVTTLVEQWLSSSANSEAATDMGHKQNYGVGVMVSSSHASESRSFYTKKFFARDSEFFFKRPALEARWDSRKRDNRGNFIYSSSLATADENLNKIYLYNYFRGQLRNIPDVGTGNIYVSFYSGSADDSAPSGSELLLVVDGTHVTHANRNTVVTGSYSSTGIYTASVALTAATTPLTTVYDVWFSGGVGQAPPSTVRYHTGSIKPQTLDSYTVAPSDKYVTNITNLKPAYSTTETARFRVYTRAKGWNPTIYSVASTVAENTEIESGSYKVFRVVDELDVIPYGTGSDLHTAMSYDLSGNYFDLDMSMLKEDYMYGIKFTYYNNSIGDWVEQPGVFKFRVEK